MRKFATVFATLACLLLSGRADAGGPSRGRLFAPRAPRVQFNIGGGYARQQQFFAAPQQQFFAPRQQFYAAPQQQFYVAPQVFRAPPVFRAPDYCVPQQAPPYCPPQGRAFFPGY
jgi:hypothetical protein